MPRPFPRRSRTVVTAGVEHSTGRGRLRRLAAQVRSRVVGVPADLWLVLVALVVLVIGWSTITLTEDAPTSLLPVLAVMEVAPLVMLRRWPFQAWAVALGGSLVWWAIPTQPDFPMPWPVVQFLVLLASVFVAAMVAELTELAAIVVVTAAALLVTLPDELKAWALGQALIAVFGLLVRWLVISRRQLARKAEDVEVERARRAVLEERSRIARELHDVVAHHMSMVVVQAQSAPVRLPDVSPAVREELAAIEASARRALTEVRGVLGVLRDEGAPPTAPQPGLEQVPALLEGTRAAGVDATWRLDLPSEECPEGTALVLHRILQESLANATRHAPGSRIEVALWGSEGTATLLVRNGPLDAGTGAGGDGAGDDGTGGSGIPGMQARAEAVGGQLSAGRHPDGFFVVEAVVPLEGRPHVRGPG